MTSPRKEKFKSKLSTAKIMATVFWDDKGVIVTLLAQQDDSKLWLLYWNTKKNVRSIVLPMTKPGHPQVWMPLRP
jgi:hypothetical protein